MMQSILESFRLSDCSKILEKKLKSSNFKVNSYKACPLDEIKGFLGDYCYIRIHYNRENKDESERFFVKIKSATGYRQDFLNENGLFSKECQFYQKLIWDISHSGVHIINECVPVCYFVSDDEYLIFEELERKGYANQKGILTSLDYVKSGLDSIVRLHASGFIFEEKMKSKLGRDFKLPQNYQEIFAESFFLHTKISDLYLKSSKQAAETQINLISESLNVDIKKLKDLICDIYDKFPEIVTSSDIYRNTICHGDLWSSNIMFKVIDDKPIHNYIVDFQTVRYGPPAQDFMIYLYLTVDRKIRQDLLTELMEYYYKELSMILEEYGVCPGEILPYEEFVASCNYYKLFACALAMSHHQLIMLPQDARGKLLKEGIIQDMIFEDRSELVREYWTKDAFYKNKINENLMDFRDILIENQQISIKCIKL